jgi:hypothetical protein
MGDPSLRRNRTLDVFTILVVLAALVYAALAWTPSSYAAVFDQLALPREGLVLGEPREIREDEWIRWTPFFRVAVNNGFGRINETSPYAEDLRSPEAVPLADWALALRPYFWPFFVLDAAHAFSAYHAFWLAAFLLGYHHLFRALGWGRATAAAASLTLFFAGFNQLWWTTYGSLVAGFPWVPLAILAPWPPWLRAVAVAYATASWLLANLHPHIQVTLGFVAGVLLLAFRRDALRPRVALPAGLGVALGAAVVVLYFGEIFLAMAETVYPGRREGGGGGGSVLALQWLSHFFPLFVTRGYETVIAAENVCEAATVGSWVPVLTLFFADWRDLRARLARGDAEGRELRRRLALLAIGAVATSLWILLPVPAELGTPLLWHTVPAKRMWLACGLLLFVLFLGLLREAGVVFSWWRALGATGAIVGSCLVSEGLFGGDASRPTAAWASLWILAPLGVVCLARRALSGAFPAALVGCAAFANLLAFGSFNPIQSARSIFRDLDPAWTAPFDRLARRHPRGWLVLDGTSGAWLNGLGYASVTHVLYAPQLEWFRTRLPDLDEATFQWLFNRTLYVLLTPKALPELYSEPVAYVPADVFEAPTIGVQLAASPLRPSRTDGFVESVDVYQELDGSHVLVRGWAPFDASEASARLVLWTDLPVAQATAYPVHRPDVARNRRDRSLLVSGFALRLDLTERTSADAAGEAGPDSLAGRSICLASEDRVRGRFLLPSPEGIGRCARSTDP